MSAGVVQRLLKGGRWPEPDAVANAARGGREIVAALGEVLQSDLRRKPEESALWVIIGLTGQTAAKAEPDVAVAAAQDLCGLYRRYDDDTLELVTEALVQIGPVALPAVEAVLADRVVRWYGRAMASAAAVRLARAREDDRKRVGQLLRGVLDERPRGGDPSDNDKLLWAAVAWGLAVLPDPGARPRIEKLLSRGHINEPSISGQAIAEAYKREAPRERPPAEPFAAAYRKRFELERMKEDWIDASRKDK